MKPVKFVIALWGVLFLFFGGGSGNTALGGETGGLPEREAVIATGEGTDMPYSTKGIPSSAEKTEGMTPFYISHLGRHGSRYPVSEKNLFQVLNFLLFEEQGTNLTEKGKALFEDGKKLEQEFLNSWGMLSPVGVEEQKGIARRMVVNYPELFVPTARIRAISSFMPRCGQSMRAFVGELAQEKPGIAPIMAQGWQYNRILRSFDEAPAFTRYKREGDWRPVYQTFRREVIHPDALVARLFVKKPGRSDAELRAFTLALFQTAAVLPASGSKIRLDAYFTPEEWTQLWETQNLRQYLERASSPLGKGLPAAVAWPLLQEFMENADRAVPNSTQPSLSLRFSHAEAVIPFAVLMGINKASASIAEIDQVSRYWKDYEITPMSANIQWVFYRDGQGKVWVKFLLNEVPVKINLSTDHFPLYAWEEVKVHFNAIVDEARRKAVIEGPPVFD